MDLTEEQARMYGRVAAETAKIAANEGIKTIHDIESFAKKLAKSAAKKLWEKHKLKVDAQTTTFMKNNNQERVGITFRQEGITSAPNIYVENAYQQLKDGVPFEKIADDMTEAAYQAIQHRIDLPELTPENARKHITLTVVNTMDNQALLEQTPHVEILGGELSAIPRWFIDDNSSFIVNDGVVAQLGLTSDEVLQIGQQHINAQHFEAKSMQQVLSEMMGDEFMDIVPPGEGPQMIVLTSETKIQGANALLSESALNEVHEMLDSDFVVLPSSIHEVLCLPITDDMNPDDLRAMVREVNMGQVAPEERLSDQIFRHDGKKLTLVGDSFQMDTPKIDTPKLDGHKVRMAM